MIKLFVSDPGGNNRSYRHVSGKKQLFVKLVFVGVDDVTAVPAKSWWLPAKTF